jgi:hypothetical protein
MGGRNFFARKKELMFKLVYLYKKEKKRKGDPMIALLIN